MDTTQIVVFIAVLAVVGALVGRAYYKHKSKKSSSGPRTGGGTGKPYRPDQEQK